MTTIHGTGILISGVGVLLRGASGAGKSDLAMRLIDEGAILIADDRVEVQVDQGKVTAAAPARLTGLIEVRGVGIMRVPFVPRAELHLVVDLVAPGLVERLPEVGWTPVVKGHLPRIADVRLPRIALAPFEASAPAKVRLAAAAAYRGDLGVAPALA